MIRRFYAVTFSGSIYCASETSRGVPGAEARKIHGASDCKVKIGDALTGGSLVAVTSIGLVAYTPHHRDGRYIESTNMRNWGGRTSVIVALFLIRSKAEDCLREGNLQPWDPRWRTKTQAVIDKIGPDHPSFIIAGSVARGENWVRRQVHVG